MFFEKSNSIKVLLILCLLLICCLLVLYTHHLRSEFKRNTKTYSHQELYFSNDTIHSFKNKWNSDSTGCSGFRSSLCRIGGCQVGVLEYILQGQAKDSIVSCMGKPDVINHLGEGKFTYLYFTHCKPDSTAAVSLLKCNFRNDTLVNVVIPIF